MLWPDSEPDSVLKKWDRYLATPLNQEAFWLMAKPVPVFQHAAKHPFRSSFAIAENTENDSRVSRIASEAGQGRVMKKAISSIRSVTPKPTPKPAVADGWTFLTNHTHVLLCLYHNPDRRLRDVAQMVGITERMVQKVVADLSDAGYLKISKEGRCNHYDVNSNLKLRHTLEMHHTVGELLDLLRPLEEVPQKQVATRRTVRS